MSELYQIFYKEEQKSKLYPFAKPYFNESLSIFFENAPISKLVTSSSAEKIAVCSWKLSQKIRNIHPVTEKALNSDYQVLSFTRNSKKHVMIAMAAQWHKGFLPAIDLLWTKLGYKRPGEARNPIYQNHFSATIEIYKDYVNSFLNPAMEIINTDEELNALMLQPSGYGKLTKQSEAPRVKQFLGMTDYPLCPFVLERCPSLWMQMKGYKITYL
jgi:hypothetical protein